FGPPGYRAAALALSGTSQEVEEQFIAPKKGGPLVGEARLVPNPDVLPMVRAYDQAVVVQNADFAPVLAGPLAQRNIGVVTGGADVSRRLGPAVRATLPGDDPCAPQTVGRLEPGVAAEAATAC